MSQEAFILEVGEQGLAEQYKIENIPTLMMFQEGEVNLPRQGRCMKRSCVSC